ncbi:daf-12-interacting protein 1-like [Ostrinia furnacalis]|uniref:daf-12-interacting protein 1-like n=1 Tax=Ostrinia furnacalis TaxID=93504 RepID=UPI00103A6594|nr:daf-12-interacting protein 1-like [Ostrinia furnacalis]
MIGMMWFKREPKPVSEKPVENGVVGKLRRKKAVLLKPTRESSERETSTESDKERRRYSDILDMKVSLERRDESDESLYESADCHSDAISASDDALPRLGKTPTLSKESLKLAVTDEEVDITRNKKGHRKTMSLSNPLEIVKNLGDEWFESAKKDLEKCSDKKKSRESLWSEEDRDSIHGSNMKLDQIRKNSKKEDKSQSNSRKSSTTDAPKRKSSKGSSVSALNLFRRKKTPTSMKPVEVLSEDAVDKVYSIEEILHSTLLFLEGEKRHAATCDIKPPQETDSDDEPPTPKILGEHRRRLSRQTSRGKSKVRGKSQSVKVNTLRKSHSGTLKKAKKKSAKTPSIGRSRQASIVEQTPVPKKKNSDSVKHSSWFSSSRGESRREGSAEEQTAPDADVDTSDTATKDVPDKDNNWRAPPAARGVNRAESCRERDAPRRGKHRNASDPNRLTAHTNQ